MDAWRELTAHLQGSPLCQMLQHKVLHDHDCGGHLVEQCRTVLPWVNYSSAATQDSRVVVSYAHNGFGNQLFQHTIGYLVAKSLNASFYVDAAGEGFWNRQHTPSNTLQGMSILDSLVPDPFKMYLLDPSHPHRQLCEAESFYWSDRPSDSRNKTYKASFGKRIKALLVDPAPRCLKLVGFFQSTELCLKETRALWMPGLLRNLTVAHLFHKDDISIYLRCHPHYHTAPPEYYANILSRTTVRTVWLFLSPLCPIASKSTIEYLQTLNHRVWKYSDPDDPSASFLYDFVGLMSSPRLILPHSSWAFWAGVLSNATEIHVDPTYHKGMGIAHPQYVYHNYRRALYYGKYQRTVGDEVDILYQHNLRPK